MRRPLVAANWKMNMTCAETVKYLTDFTNEVEGLTSVDVVICPPFTALRTASTYLEYEKSNIALGSQNMHWEEKGAYTGEISVSMLKELNVSWVITGHSERRRYFNEDNETVTRKVRSAIESGIKPIICVGESLEERENDQTLEVIRTQVLSALEAVKDTEDPEFSIAYEPIWAIGTGKAADPESVNDVARHIRALVGTVFFPDLARRVRIIYGGSIDADNFHAFLSEPDIDGGLVGGASLSANTFSKLVRIAS